MPECVKVVDTKGHLTFMNPAGLGMIEADSLEQVAGLPVLELIAPEYRDAFAQLHADVLLGESRQMKFEIVSIKGHRRWVETNAVPFAEGDHIVQLAVTRDVTERIQSDEKLRKLSLAVEQSPASILITDLQARIEFANESFYQSTGYDRDDIIGNNPKILQSGKTPVATYRDMWAALTEGKEWRGELYNRKRNGEEYVESAVITPLRNEDGQITNYVAVKNDITEKKQLIADLEAHRSNLELLVLQRTEELNAAKIQADTANVAKSAFLANMSHEIRTPMNGIIGMTNILRREGVTPQQAKRINTIDTSAQHLLSIINDILDLSKVEAGKLTLEELPVSISSIIANVSSILSERANTKGIHLLTEVGHFPHNLIGDPTRLQQAILNYVANAIKFTEKGSVTIRAIQEDETDDLVRIRLEVTDTGIGISPQTMSKLFTSFEQADNSTTRKYGGTGLGLAITRRLAELMDGEAGAISEPGVGSTFWFTVKLKKFGDGTTVVIHTDVGAEAELQQRFAGQRVLVTDDDPVNLEVAVIQIEAAGLIADTASDGVEAVESAQKVLYAAIFMDMQMPNLNGMDATRQIRTIPGYRHTPIIAMTANAYAEDKAQCLDAGMSDFLIKPFVPVELFSVLLKALKQRKD
jgi:PAS domain S-box-containing protein